jgi:hypothetical protein
LPHDVRLAKGGSRQTETSCDWSDSTDQSHGSVLGLIHGAGNALILQGREGAPKTAVFGADDVPNPDKTGEETDRPFACVIRVQRIGTLIFSIKRKLCRYKLRHIRQH